MRETEALAPAAERAALSVPEGFEITLFAAEPMINKPVNLAVDGRGRVWVSSTVEYPYAAARDRWEDGQGSRVHKSRDAIKILEDADGDGRADRVTDFAEHPDGCPALAPARARRWLSRLEHSQPVVFRGHRRGRSRRPARGDLWSAWL